MAFCVLPTILELYCYVWLWLFFRRSVSIFLCLTDGVYHCGAIAACLFTFQIQKQFHLLKNKTTCSVCGGAAQPITTKRIITFCYFCLFTSMSSGKIICITCIHILGTLCMNMNNNYGKNVFFSSAIFSYS